MREALTIIVTGYAAMYPVGGATFDYLQYVAGFRRLGHRVYYLEDTGRWTWDCAQNTFSDNAASNAAYLGKWIATLDPALTRSWCLRDIHGRYYGISQTQIAEICREADVFINYAGGCVMRDEYMACKTKVYLDSDPLYGQAGIVSYLDGTADDQTRCAIDCMRRHDKFVSFGENIGAADCAIPTALFSWQPTRQPVVRDLWESHHPRVRDVFTTVMSWQPDDGAVILNGVSYGGKHAEFGKFMAVPQHTKQALELAIGGGSPPVGLLRESGWHVVDAYGVSSDPWKYRDYICSSRAEFSVAKQAYVAMRSGWFSGRSACYLAAGKPVIVQDTGFSDHIRTGKGLLTFSTQEEAVEAIARINRDYQQHSAAAASIADEFFDSTRVLKAFLASVLE